MIPVETVILIVLLKFPRIVCSTDYLLVNGVVKKYSQSLSDEQEHGVHCSSQTISIRNFIMKKSSETSSPSTQQPEKTAVKTVEILLEMPTIITDASARKQAVKHFVTYAEKNCTKTAEQLEPFLRGATCSVDDSGHLKIERKITTSFPPRKLSVYCHWAEEVWNSCLPSLLESNGMIKCEIK